MALGIRDDALRSSAVLSKEMDMQHVSTVTLVLAACIGCSQPSLAGTQATSGHAGHSSAPAVTSNTSRTLCKPEETVIFSCRIRGSRKLVSLCGARDFAANPEAYAYYAFGTAGAAELHFPEVATAARQSFQRNWQIFSGGTGGYVYSFHNHEFDYYLYSISGRQLEDQGLIVSEQGSREAKRRLKCAPATVVESHDENVFVRTWEWPENPDVLSRGVPEWP